MWKHFDEMKDPDKDPREWIERIKRTIRMARKSGHTKELRNGEKLYYSGHTRTFVTRVKGQLRVRHALKTKSGYTRAAVKAFRKQLGRYL